jgi:glutaminyl-peptide cyclotransferase
VTAARLLPFVLLATTSLAFAQEPFSGDSAHKLTGEIVALGPRPPGSAAARKMHTVIVSRLKSWGWQVEEDAFTASTPIGRLPMKNIIARLPGQPGGRLLVVSGHTDTKKLAINFVGANDAGSSTGFLLELARAFRNAKLKHDLVLVFFDGEEAIRDWSDSDSLYGSRRLAGRWHKDGTLARINALINVDMIGDRDLVLLKESYSSEPLQRLVWSVARELGFARHFGSQGWAVEDDHTPFLRLGVRAINLIDFDYGPNNAWWHTDEDTMDKLSPKSFEVVGRVVAETLKRLDR